MNYRIYGKKAVLKKDGNYEDAISEFYTSVFKLFGSNDIKHGKILGFAKNLSDDIVENIFGIKTDIIDKVCELDVFDIDEIFKKDYFQTVNCYFDEDSKPDDYDSIYLEAPQDYTERFNNICKYLNTNIPEGIIKKIEHYGSTAIKGIPAKPIVDILLQTEDFETARDFILPILDKPEWEYWMYNDHMIFIGRDKFQGNRQFHIHIAPENHRLWNGIIFRDYLNCNPEIAEKYASLKKELCERFSDDRERYTKEKGDFIKKVLKEAGNNFNL